eukprot:SAG31_NODE_16532_length_705_cov_1.102310_1_plen_112_part_10
MYEPEPEEEPFEFDPGDPDMPRCIPCYIRWWNMYYAPVGYPFLLYERHSSRRLLQEAVDYVGNALSRIFGWDGTADGIAEQSWVRSRRKMAEGFVGASVCEEGYRGDRCEWL